MVALFYLHKKGYICTILKLNDMNVIVKIHPLPVVVVETPTNARLSVRTP